MRHLLEHYEFDQDGSLRIQWTLATERKSQKVGFQGLGKREVGGGRVRLVVEREMTRDHGAHSA